MVLAVASATEGDRKATTKWLALTALGGALFLLGQMEEYFGVMGIFAHGLTHEGLTFGASAYASTFYVTTSFHGLHVLTGTIYILITLFRNMNGKTDANEIEILGLVDTGADRSVLPIDYAAELGYTVDELAAVEVGQVEGSASAWLAQRPCKASVGPPGVPVGREAPDLT